jgi:hypothetical protein
MVIGPLECSHLKIDFHNNVTVGSVGIAARLRAIRVATGWTWQRSPRSAVWSHLIIVHCCRPTAYDSACIVVESISGQAVRHWLIE